MKIQEYKELCAIVLDHLEKVQGSEIDIKDILYWAITNRFNIATKPTLGIGSLTDETGWLRDKLSGEMDPHALDLKWFGHLLIDLSQQS